MARKYRRNRSGQFAGGTGSSGRAVSGSKGKAGKKKKEILTKAQAKQHMKRVTIGAAIGLMAAGPVGMAAGAYIGAASARKARIAPPAASKRK